MKDRYPQLFQPNYGNDPYAQNVYDVGGQNHAYNVGSGSNPGYRPALGQQEIQEVVATCDRKYCYKSCRLMLVGSGRCTKAGCMCYHAFFNYDGSPANTVYQEDNIW